MGLTNNYEIMKREKWERIKRKGFFRFVIYRGILKIGLPFSIIISCYYYYSFNGWDLTDFEISTFLIEYFMSIFFGYCILIMIISFISWNTHLKKYKD